MKVLYGYLFVNNKGEELALTKSECRLLKCLHDNDIAQISDIALAVYNIKDYLGNDLCLNNAIRMLIYRLRKKINKDVKIINRNRIGYSIPRNSKIKFIDFERYNNRI